MWFGDEVDGLRGGIDNIDLYERTTNLYDVDVNLIMSFGERLKRPAPKVLDADGVEIEVGDTVYGIGRTEHQFEVIDPHHIDPEVGEAFSVRCYDSDEHEECHCKPKLLTHTRPDSWERLEEDAADLDDMPCDFNAKDLVRRAKALAGAEAGR